MICSKSLFLLTISWDFINSSRIFKNSSIEIAKDVKNIDGGYGNIKLYEGHDGSSIYCIPIVTGKQIGRAHV